MALVTVQRSPSASSSPPSSDSGAGGSVDEEDSAKSTRSLSECYFAVKGAALVLPPNERLRPNRRVSASGSDIQQHLQSMFYLLRPEETLKMAVKLESVHPGRTRYLVVVSCVGRQDAEESCLLGIDCNERTTVGLVLRVLADTAITLDGDGGFSVSVCGRQHIFKPVSVQAMWSALQTLHKVSSKAREQNYFLGGLTHDWVSYYEQRIDSDRSCLNEWHAMDSLESRRPPSPDSVRTKPREREETERIIRCKLKEIMMSVDLDEVTSKYIRSRLEEDLDMDLGEFKPFIDQEMLTILGQMDAATEIFDHVYLGSEWNASNLEELQNNGVGHILNVTREIDNFFPGMFDYLNIRVYDDEKTDLLKYWDNTYRYINRAKKDGSKVLVHCKMGVSRSASVVIAYAMKSYNWDLKKAIEHVKDKRSCIKPNSSFMTQLETYQGMLDAMKNKEKLQRSKSETNLKSPGLVAKAEKDKTNEKPQPGPPQHRMLGTEWALDNTSGQELSRVGGRPKSWSPDNSVATSLFLGNAAGPTSLSLERLSTDGAAEEEGATRSKTTSDQSQDELAEARNYNLNVRMPCSNGNAYSVSQNSVMYLPGNCPASEHSEDNKDLSEPPCASQPESTDEKPVQGIVASVKHRVNELESQNQLAAGKKSANKENMPDRRGLVLNLTSQFESTSKPGSPVEEEYMEDPVLSQTKSAPQKLQAVLVKKETWDPGESSTDPPDLPAVQTDPSAWNSGTMKKQKCELPDEKHKFCIAGSGRCPGNGTEEKKCFQSVPVRPGSVQCGGTRTPPPKKDDPFSAQLDRVFEREERKQQRVSTVVPMPELPIIEGRSNESRDCPSRQSSWSSYDSAVVLGYQGERESPSRQSSWGSGDTRWTYGTLPSRNSSWGSYDMKPMQCVNERGEQQMLDASHNSAMSVDNFFNSSSGMFSYDRESIPWHPGTVKRTKQKLEEGTATIKRVCSESDGAGVSERSDSSSSSSSSSSTNSPSPKAEGVLGSNVNVKIHGPRPYQNPCEKLTLDQQNLLEKSIPLQTPIVHYASTPTLCHPAEDDTVGFSVEKMTSSQPNIVSSTLCFAFPESSKVPQQSAIDKLEFEDLIMNCHQSIETMLSTGRPSEVESSECVQPVCVSSSDSSTTSSKLSETSPSIIKTPQTSVKLQKQTLENLGGKPQPPPRKPATDDAALCRPLAAEAKPADDAQKQQANVGVVQNLKKEFEAKSGSSKREKMAAMENMSKDAEVVPEPRPKKNSSNKIRSLPTSPVSTEPKSHKLSPTEDLSVKKLVGKFEVSKTSQTKCNVPSSPVNGRTRFLSENETAPTQKKMSCMQPPIPPRKSSLDVASIQNNAPILRQSVFTQNLKNGSDVGSTFSGVSKSIHIERKNGNSTKDSNEANIMRSYGSGTKPPHVLKTVPPSNVAISGVKAKKQQGKTHPLARLTIKPRHNNPVYNTM